MHLVFLGIEEAAVQLITASARAAVKEDDCGSKWSDRITRIFSLKGQDEPGVPFSFPLRS